MARRSAVLSRANGTRRARLMLIGEAPGRLGADRTHEPFAGDRSGDNLSALLAGAGIDKGDIYLTNAVLCCPTDGSRNFKPKAAELSNCRPFLRATIDAIQPVVVATLGRVAFEQVRRALNLNLPRRPLSELVGDPIPTPWFVLAPLYHPSPRVIHTRRSFDAQLADLTRVVRLLHDRVHRAGNRAAPSPG